MPPVTTDRDLLAHEPRLFNLVAWTGQQLVNTTGATIDSSGLILTLPGVDFDALDITTGHVALINDIPAEITSRLSPTSLAISRPRAARSDSPIPFMPLAGAVVRITTFQPQIRLIHDHLLQELNLESESAPVSTGPAENAITNTGDLIRLEALGALHLVTSAAAIVRSEDSILWMKSRLYRERFIAARRQLVVRLDLDGDGAPDAARQLATRHLVRS